MSEARAHRGATRNDVPQRFNLADREADGDWLDECGDLDGAPPQLRTTVTVEKPRTIITHNKSPDVPFDRSINAYRGCEHGCIYCFARPTHAFHDLSPGIDFETRLFAKPDAPALLRAELAKRGYVCAPIAMGTNTDPYQPIEREWRITRELVEILHDCDHPLMITTKSDRVTRDIDLLGPMAAKRLTSVMVSVTSLTPKIAMTMEPRAPAPRRRLAAIEALSKTGVPVQLSISPIVPGITDGEIEAIVAAGAAAGARRVSFIPVRLPYEVAPLFRAWLDEHFPERAGKVMSIINSIRGGRDNDPRFGERMRGQGAWYDLIRTRVKLAAKKHGLDQRIDPPRTDLFRPPAGAQGVLF